MEGAAEGWGGVEGVTVSFLHRFVFFCTMWVYVLEF